MNNLEQQLIDIDERMADAIRKQKLSVAETIHKVAEDSINACRTLDDEFREIFPELAELEPTPESDIQQKPFNPEYVIEIKDGKGNKFIDTWDKTTGLLPNRRVMGKYSIQYGDYFKLFTNSKNIYCLEHNDYIENEHLNFDGSYWLGNLRELGGLNRYGKIDCNSCLAKYSNVYEVIESGKFVIGADEITSYSYKPFNKVVEIILEVDNYLNLYDPKSNTYLLFNKIVFPIIPFIIRPELFKSKNIIGDTTKLFDYKIYKDDPAFFNYNSKLITPNELSNSKFLAAVPELIPDDYYKVIDFYDRFRRMSSYTRGLGQLGSQRKLFDPETQKLDSEELSPSGNGLPTTDTRDKLIRELESRLSGCLKQIELTDEYNRELVDLFTKQSAEVLDLTRRLNQQTADKQTTETAKRLAENQEIFALKKQLADAQSYIARCQMLGTDIARLETELTDSQLETQKYKDLAQGLTDQLLSVKRELRDKSAEHAAAIKTSTRDMSRIAGLEKDNTRLTQDNLAAQSKIRDLEAQILGGNINSKPEKEALEQVLITKCDELTRDRDELSRKYSELVKVNKQLERDYEEFRGSITKLMTGR